MALPKWVARANRRVTNPIIGRFAHRLPGFAILEHIGRKSGRTYRIPIIVFRREGEYIIALTYGPDTDWVKNVLAAGGCTIDYRGRTVRLTRPRIVTDAGSRGVPLPVRMIVEKYLLFAVAE